MTWAQRLLGRGDRGATVSRLAENALADLREAGRVLSAANEEKLVGARDAIQAVLDSIDSATSPAEKTAAAEAKRGLVEAYSASATDAASGASILQSLLYLISDESDEPEQLAMLQRAYDALAEWMRAEIGEIGDPDDQTQNPFEPGPVDESAPAPDTRVGDVALVESAVPLAEAAIAPDGRAKLKLIAPGWGSTGYYGADVLERDGKTAFPAGTKCFWDHPTKAEEMARPEGSLQTLAAITESPATWIQNGPAGPGLYADAKVFAPFRPTLEELAPHIGVSIRGLGRASMGEAEGRKGPIIEALTQGISADFVTTPGAGGQVLQLFEAARAGRPQPTPQEDALMTEQEQQSLRESQARIARLSEQVLLMQAERHIASRLMRESRLPDVTRNRLAAELASNPPANEAGELDVAAYDDRISEAVKREAEYLASIGVGQVRGFSPTTGGGEQNGPDLAAAFQRLGLSESQAKAAAVGRAG